VDPLDAPDDLAHLGLEELQRLEQDLERRRPGAPVTSVGVRPSRQPWTYRDIWRLEQIRAELSRRRSAGSA
jgi:hypothetical protein